MHRHTAAALERRFDHEVNLLDHRVRHGKAADAAHVAMHHDEAARALVREVVGVGVADIERQVVAASGIELLGRETVKALRGLHVALTGFRPQRSRETSDGIGAKQPPRCLVILEPKLKLPALFEDTDESRLAKLALLRSKFVRQFGQEPRTHIG